jgi:hypothetical protein
MSASSSLKKNTKNKKNHQQQQSSWNRLKHYVRDYRFYFVCLLWLPACTIFPSTAQHKPKPIKWKFNLKKKYIYIFFDAIQAMNKIKKKKNFRELVCCVKFSVCSAFRYGGKHQRNRNIDSTFHCVYVCWVFVQRTALCILYSASAS